MRLVDPRHAVAVLTLVLLPLRAAAIVSFSTTEQLEEVGSASAQALTLADLDGDNVDDLVTVVLDTDTVAVYLNDGNGELELNDEYDVAGEAPVAVATGLFNEDNFRDIVAVNNVSGTVSILLGLGDGTFDTDDDPRQFVVGAQPIGVGVGDFNNDREDDLVVLSSNLVYILQGNGDGTFSAANPATVNTRSTGSFAIAVGLLDADTNLDYAVTNRANAQVVTFFGNGNLTFTFGQLVPAGDSPTGIIIADADGDRDNDLMAVDSEAQPFDEVRLMRNNGGADDELFDQPESIVAGLGPLAITGLDVEPDNKVDIAVTTVNADAMSLLCQPSDKCNTREGDPLEPMQGQGGIFRQPQGGTIPGCTREGQVAVVSGKLNGDDMDDLVALSGDLDTLCISLNTSRVGGPGTPVPTATGPTATATQTRTLAPTPTPTPIPVIGLGVCNTKDEDIRPELILGRPVAVAAADFDRDGDRDVAVADSTGDRIIILLTTLNPVAMPQMPCDALELQQGNTVSVMVPEKLATADLDVDGSDDLAVIGAQGLSVFYGDGAGGFSPSPANPMPAGMDPSGLAITDFNRDGTPDIIVSDSGSDDVSIFLGKTPRQRAQPFTGRCPMGVGRATNLVVGTDLNADARADFAVTGRVARDVGVFLQRATASLTCNNMAASFQGQTPLSLPNEPAGMVAGVFTFTDSIPDLAVAMRVDGGTGTVALFEGRAVGEGGVSYDSGTPVAIPTPETTPESEPGAAVPTDIGSGDVERDGLVDLMITDSQNNTLAEFRGQASGGIGIPLETLSTLGVGPVDLEVVDIDGDGRDDVITANSGDGSVSYMLSNQREFTPTPVNTGTATPTSSPAGTATSSPTITPTPTRTRRPSPSQTPEPTHTQRGVVSLSDNGCSIDEGSSDSGMLLLASFGLLGLIMRRRARVLLGG